MATIDTIANEAYQRHLLKGAEVAPVEVEQKVDSLVKRPSVTEAPEPEVETGKSVIMRFIDALTNDVYDSNILERAQTEPSTDVQMGSDKMYGRYKTPLHVFQAMNRDVDPDSAEMYVRETPSLDYLNMLDIDAREEEYYNQSDRLMVSADATFTFPTPAKPVPDLEVAIDKPSSVEDKELPSAGLGSRPVEEEVSLTDDDMGLPESRSETEKLIAFEPLFSFIEKGEGGYEASNRGTLNNSIVGSTNSTERDGKSLTEMTIAEIREKQAITDANNPERLFAVGRFQVIPSTLEMAIEALDLSDDTVFSENTQNKIGMYLVSEKRRNVGRYLRGEGDVSRDTAMLELAKEFASMPVPYDMTVKRGGKDIKIKKGDSYYGSGNKAQHSYAEVKKQLEELKGTV